MLGVGGQVPDSCVTQLAEWDGKLAIQRVALRQYSPNMRSSRVGRSADTTEVSLEVKRERRPLYLEWSMPRMANMGMMESIVTPERRLANPRTQERYVDADSVGPWSRRLTSRISCRQCSGLDGLR